MRYQDLLVRQTQKAVDDVCRAAMAVPADRQEWKPMGEARSTLEIMQEISGSASFFVPILREGIIPPFENGKRPPASVMACVEAARQSTGEICQVISAFPDQRLEEEITMPFGGGMKMTMGDVLGLHYWNVVYHLGQINQIQLMLGDRQMH